MSSRVTDTLISAATTSYASSPYMIIIFMFLGYPDQSIDLMDCEHPYDAYLMAGLVDGSKYHFLDPTKDDVYNTNMFLKQHLILTTTLKTLQAKYFK